MIEKIARLGFLKLYFAIGPRARSANCVIPTRMCNELSKSLINAELVISSEYNRAVVFRSVAFFALWRAAYFGMTLKPWLR